MSELIETKKIFYRNTNLLVSVDISKDSYILKTDSVTTIDDKIPSITNNSIGKHLSNSQVYIIDSMYSGAGRTNEKNVYERILKPIFNEILNIEHKYIATQTATSIREISKSFQPSQKDITIIFISGDTSINEFINALPLIDLETNVNIFTIPSGTGNSIALSLDITDEVQAVQRLLVYKGEPKPLNVYEVSFPKGSNFLSHDAKSIEIEEPLKFIVVVSWAFHASLVADSDTPELRKYGVERFKMAAYSNLSQEQAYEGSVSINNRIINGPFAYLLFTPAKRFEKTFDISPKGNIFDDDLYLVAFKSENDKTGKYIMDIMGEVYDQGKHITDKKVTYEKITVNDKLILRTKNSKSIRKRRVCVDGTIVALPETDEHEITIKSSGNVHHNWRLFIIN